jgi:hypothetical protein
MTREEAIEWVNIRMCMGRGKFTEHHPPIIDEVWEAGLMAIEALNNERQEGHWIPYKSKSCIYGDTNYICSECGHVGSKFRENFCMCCGADMRGKQDE